MILSRASRVARYSTSVVGKTRHKKVTAFNDDGSVQWGNLSPMEKASRTAQQSFNFALIAVGAAATVGVAAVLYTDVFSPNSSTVQFNRAVDRIRNDKRATDLLGDGSEIRAYGETSWNKWRRNRPISSHVETDSLGTERLHMQFHVAGPRAEGVAHLQLLRRQDEKDYHYGYLYITTPDHRVDLEKEKKNVPGKFLGIRWS